MPADSEALFTLYYRHRRRMRRVGLGRYPDVLLEKARKIATQHRGRIGGTGQVGLAEVAYPPVANHLLRNPHRSPKYGT